MPVYSKSSGKVTVILRYFTGEPRSLYYSGQWLLAKPPQSVYAWQLAPSSRCEPSAWAADRSQMLLSREVGIRRIPTVLLFREVSLKPQFYFRSLTVPTPTPVSKTVAF